MALRERRKRPEPKRKPKPKSRGSNHCPPGWAWLLAGILIGAFLSFLIYLREIAPYVPPPVIESETVETEKQTLSMPETVKLAEANSDEVEQTDTVKPHTFYDDLLNTEVDIITDIPTENQNDEPVWNGHNRYLLQVGAFRDLDAAQGLQSHLTNLSIQSYIEGAIVNNVQWHRVRIGPIINAQQFDVIRGQLEAQQISFDLVKNQ